MGLFNLNKILSSVSSPIYVQLSQPVTYNETPNEVIDGARVLFTVDHPITFILSIHINGEYFHPSKYTFTGTSITFGSPPDVSYAGLDFTITYY